MAVSALLNEMKRLTEASKKMTQAVADGQGAVTRGDIEAMVELIRVARKAKIVLATVPTPTSHTVDAYNELAAALDPFGQGILERLCEAQS